MDKPEALTFPELLETVPNDAYLTIPNETEREVRIIPVGRYCHNAAAELRRLHAENETLQAENAKLHGWFEAEAQAGGGLQRRLNRAEAQRDALLEALRLAATNLRAAGVDELDGSLIQADLAIARAEEGK